jgi:predicted nucleic acid-binding protein
MIVSNTSPLRYLIAVRQADLIEKVFRKALILNSEIRKQGYPLED